MAVSNSLFISCLRFVVLVTVVNIWKNAYAGGSFGDPGREWSSWMWMSGWGMGRARAPVAFQVPQLLNLRCVPVPPPQPEGRGCPWSSRVHKDRESNGCCQGIRGVGNGGLAFNGVSASQGEKTVRVNGSDGRTTMRMYLMPPNCTLQNG